MFLSVGSHAALVTYQITGTVTAVDPALAGTFSTNQTLNGSFTFDSSASGFLAGTEASGFRDHFTGLTSLVMNVGPYTAASGTPGLITVANNWFGSDGLTMSQTLVGTPINGNAPLGFVNLSDSTQTAFSSTQLNSVGDFSTWLSSPGHGGFWYLSFNNGGGSPRIQGNLTSIFAVPEVGTLPLAAAGLVALAAFVRLRRRPT